LDHWDLDIGIYLGFGAWILVLYFLSIAAHRMPIPAFKLTRTLSSLTFAFRL
jgi:hypothetical protein